MLRETAEMETRMSERVVTKSNLDLLVDSYSSLYKAKFRAYHKRAITCIGADKWTALAEKAIREGVDPGRYFSTLVAKEMKRYNLEKRKEK